MFHLLCVIPSFHIPSFRLCIILTIYLFVAVHSFHFIRYLFMFLLIYLLWLCYSAQLLLMILINLLLTRSFFPICSLSPFFFIFIVSFHIFIVSFHFILNYSFITIY